MYRAKSQLLGQSGVFVRYIIKKQPQSQEEPPEPSLEPSWGVLERFFIDFGVFVHYVSNEIITVGQKWSFRSRHPPKIHEKSTRIALGAPKIGLGALQSPPGGVREASWKAKLVKNRKYTQKLDGIGSILVAKTEPKTIKNRVPKLYNFRYLLESIFS